MHKNSCKYFTGLAQQVCTQGIAYRSFGAEHRIPCCTITPWPIEDRVALCALLALPTPEDLAADEAEGKRHLQEWLATAGARAARGECSQCGTQMTALVQVGPCIYVEPCGCRRGQGRLEQQGKRVTRIDYPVSHEQEELSHE